MRVGMGSLPPVQRGQPIAGFDLAKSAWKVKSADVLGVAAASVAAAWAVVEQQLQQEAVG